MQSCSSEIPVLKMRTLGFRMRKQNPSTLRNTQVLQLGASQFTVATSTAKGDSAPNNIGHAEHCVGSEVWA